jgi:hypothetical protein
VQQQDRLAIEYARGEFLTQETRLYEHLSRSFQWLMATLFAGNGGGMVALLNEGAQDLPGRIYALGWFAGGIVCSLLMGVLTTFISLRVSTAMTKMRVKMDESLITGQSCEKEFIDFLEGMKPNWKTWFPSYAGLTSLAFFMIGLGTIAGSLIRAG